MRFHKCILQTQIERLIFHLYGLAISGLAILFLCPKSKFIGIFTIAVPSKAPVKILSPSLLKFKETISPSCPLRVECYFPVSKSQSLAVWSIDPVAKKFLWGSNATATTSFWWPTKVCRRFPVSVSHNLAVLSKEPVATLSLNIGKYYP